MAKPIHPIRRFAADIHDGDAISQLAIERKITRHIKPLLDALERDGHGIIVVDGIECGRLHKVCADCRLLARWRAKLS